MSEEKQELDAQPTEQTNNETPTPEQTEEGKKAFTNPLDAMAARQQEIDEEMLEIHNRLLEGGFEGHGYSEDSVIEIPGRLFAAISNLLAQTQQNMMSVQRSMLPMNQLCEGTITGAAEFQLELSKLHEKYCLAGQTVPREALEQEAAEKEVEVTKTKEASDALKMEETPEN